MVDAVRIERQHFVVKLVDGCRRFSQSVEIADLLSGLFDDPGIVVVFRSLV